MDDRIYRRVARRTLAAAALALLLFGAKAEAGAAPAPAGESFGSSARVVERAAERIRAREYAPAAALLRDVLAADPDNRRAKELLAFALESTGDIEGERRVRSVLAAEFPTDPRVQSDYGRVLERSGKEGEALQAYRRARDRSDAVSARDLDQAIDRMRGRTAWEVGAPFTWMADPDATASRLQAGAAAPLSARHRAVLLGTRQAAESKSGREATASTSFAASLAGRGARGSWAAGPRLHVISPRGAARKDVALG